MKTILSSIIGILVLVVFSTNINAQENTEKNKQKEVKKKQIIIDQKKQQKDLDSITVNVQAETEDELRVLIDEQKKAQAESQDLLDKSVTLRYAPRHDRNERNSSNGTSYSYSYSTGSSPKIFFTGAGDNTTFTVSKKIKDALTFSSDFEYEVPENVSGLYFTFGSELEAGSLKITITKPNGKVYQVFSVAPVANVDWNKNIKIKEGEAKDYSGTWKITISTKEAKGEYELKITSF